MRAAVALALRAPFPYNVPMATTENVSDPQAVFDAHAAAVRASRIEERRRARSAAQALGTLARRVARLMDAAARAKKEADLAVRRAARYSAELATARRAFANFRQEAPPSVDSNGWPIPPVRPTRAQLAQRARRARESSLKAARLPADADPLI